MKPSRSAYVACHNQFSVLRSAAPVTAQLLSGNAISTPALMIAITDVVTND
jgi:hypothetical protein